MIYSIYLNIIVKVFVLGIYILTGTIGSGKSEAQKIFEKFNYDCFCADKIVKDLYNKDEVILGVKNILPKSVENNVIDIQFLREKIFSDKRIMQDIEDYIQPKVFKEFQKKIKLNKNRNIILVLPTIKNNLFHQKYKFIYISASKENRIKRIRTRKNYNINLIKEIIKYQDNIDVHRKSNNFFLDNNGTIENLEHSIKKIVKLL